MREAIELQAVVAMGALLVTGLVAGTPASAAAEAADLVQQGEYLAHAGGCGACHTAPDGEPYAGGRRIETPFGVLASPNITPDPETGIGKWSEADFERALRQGTNEEGEPLYPAMPYVSYTKMTDEDVHALWAYLQSVTPVHNRGFANKLSFPFNIRTGVNVWQELFFEPGRFQPTAGKDNTWNRGAYLVEALGHCAACHSPRNIAGAIKEGQELTGGRIDVWYAPDISGSSMSSLKDWSVDDLAKFLKTGDVGNVVAFGRMAEVIHKDVSHLNDADLHAIAVYLKNQPLPAEQPAAPAKAALPTARYASGEALYQVHCETCHRANGEGVPGAAPTLADNAAITAPKPYNVITAILKGFEPRESWSGMPAFATVLADQEVADVANYVRNSWGNEAGGENATAWMVGAWRGDTDSPQVGAAPTPQFICPALSSAGRAPTVTEALHALAQGDASHAEIVKLVDSYKAAHPQSSVADVVSDLTADYCGVVAKKEIPFAQKGAELADFVGEVADLVTGRRANGD